MVLLFGVVRWLCLVRLCRRRRCLRMCRSSFRVVVVRRRGGSSLGSRLRRRRSLFVVLGSIRSWIRSRRSVCVDAMWVRVVRLVLVPAV